MKKIIVVSIMIVSLALMISCSSNSNSELISSVGFKETEVDYKEDFDQNIISGINELGYDVLKILYSDKSEENHLFSPISLSTALSMLENGADNKTSDEILDVMYLKNEENLNETYNSLINYFNNQEEYFGEKASVIKMANSFWFKDKGLSIDEEYINKIKSFYNGDIFTVDFSKEETKDIMNTWINEKTEGLLKDTIKETKEEDLAYLINTLYFNGPWKSEFNESLTINKDFTLSSGEVVKVDMMHKDFNQKYLETKDFEVTSLDYNGQSMYIILPKTSVEDLIEKYDENIFNFYDKDFEEVKINLDFPKFKYKSNNDLKDLLIALGMKSSFDYKVADFTRMIKDVSEIEVSKIFQNTSIEVDEKGTEAAAVTVIGISFTSMPMEPEKQVEMNFNKPFLFVIKDNKTNSDLFIGIVNNPNEE